MQFATAALVREGVTAETLKLTIDLCLVACHGRQSCDWLLPKQAAVVPTETSLLSPRTPISFHPGWGLGLV
jgi:hypothetical protein